MLDINHILPLLLIIESNIHFDHFPLIHLVVFLIWTMCDKLGQVKQIQYKNKNNLIFYS